MAGLEGEVRKSHCPYRSTLLIMRVRNPYYMTVKVSASEKFLTTCPCGGTREASCSVEAGWCPLMVPPDCRIAPLSMQEYLHQ